MTLGDLGDFARQISSIASTLVLLGGFFWFLFRKLRAYHMQNIKALNDLKDGQLETRSEVGEVKDQFKLLNGSVARHEKAIGDLDKRHGERLSALEGAVFHRPPISEETL